MPLFSVLGLGLDTDEPAPPAIRADVPWWQQEELANAVIREDLNVLVLGEFPAISAFPTKKNMRPSVNFGGVVAGVEAYIQSEGRKD